MSVLQGGALRSYINQENNFGYTLYTTHLRNVWFESRQDKAGYVAADALVQFEELFLYYCGHQYEFWVGLQSKEKELCDALLVEFTPR